MEIFDLFLQLDQLPNTERSPVRSNKNSHDVLPVVTPALAQRERCSIGRV
jgi:hypothetical protein